MKIRTALTMSVLLLMLGCSKLTLENYSKIDTGMTFEEVTALIGSPERCDDVLGIRNCEWGDEKRSVKVSFVGGKVILFTSSNLK